MTDHVTIARGSSSQIEEARHVVVRTDEEWAALWSAHGGDGAPPPIDFALHMVVGVFLGARPTAGFSVEILDTTVSPSPERLTVRYTEHRPAAGDPVAQALTFPFQLIRVPRHHGSAVFFAIIRRE